MDAAGCEVVDRKARLAGNGRSLAKRRNVADDRFTTRPKGVTQMIQFGVAALEKDSPFPADCALSWIIWVTLNQSNLPCWTTRLGNGMLALLLPQGIVATQKQSLKTDLELLT